MIEFKDLKFICAKCGEEFEITNIEELIEYNDEYNISISEISEWVYPDNVTLIMCLPCLRLYDDDVDDVDAGVIIDDLVSSIRDQQTENDDGPDFWTSEIKMLESCSAAPQNVSVRLKPLVKMKVDKLMDMFPNIEWLGYFIGKVVNDEYIAEDLLIPEQTISTGSVTNVHFSVPIGVTVIGVAHSHHTMGSFFSGTDKEFINSNHNMSIVFSRNDMKGQVRWKAPCGGFKIVDAEIKFDFGVDWNTEEFEADVKEKINSNMKVYLLTQEQKDILQEKIKYYNPSYKKEKFNPSKNKYNMNKRDLPDILRGQNPHLKMNDIWGEDDTSLKDEISKIEI